MDRTTLIALVGGASALAMAGSAEASAPAPEGSGLAPATSYAELLDPIPGASKMLRAGKERGPAERPVQLAQDYGNPNYHHHHHQQWGWGNRHHRQWGWNRRYHHHHHHHRYW